MTQVIQWKTHPLFPDYDISEFGDVIRNVDRHTKKNGSRVRGTIDIDGYIRYNLFDENGTRHSITAHRLVIETFKEFATDDNLEVRHLNGSRVANHYSNLEWATRKVNHYDRQIHDTGSAGEKNGRATITEDDVRHIRSLRGTASVKQIARNLKMPYDVVYNVIQNKSWTHIV